MINAYKSFSLKAMQILQAVQHVLISGGFGLEIYSLRAPSFLTYGNALANLIESSKSALIVFWALSLLSILFLFQHFFLPSLALMVRRLRDAGFHSRIYLLFYSFNWVVFCSSSIIFAMPIKGRSNLSYEPSKRSSS